MDTFRLHGQPPFRIAVLHGGPGDRGDMAPVAKELSDNGGVLEPLQTAWTVDGQVEELKSVLEAHAELPVVLVGYSWGAWLGLILTARYPSLVKKLVLVSAGPFEVRYAAGIYTTRMNRLDESERAEFERLVKKVETPEDLARLGALCTKADTCDSIEEAVVPNEPSDLQPRQFQQVWTEAAQLRADGTLMDLARKVRCPVIAIHGDHDPHPAEGVLRPLSRVLVDFRFFLLKKCGHTPWKERWARDAFFNLLRTHCR